jgi:hypothetical protein
MPKYSLSGIKTLENQSPTANTPGSEDKDKQGNPYQIVLEPFLCGSLHGVRWNQDLEQFGVLHLPELAAVGMLGFAR